MLSNITNQSQLVKDSNHGVGRNIIYWIEVPPTPGALVVNIGDLLRVLQRNTTKLVCRASKINKHLVYWGYE